jgi:hypothetical protein
MGFRAALLGGLRYLPEILLQYRTDVGISSEGARLRSFPEQRLRHAEIMLATLRQRHADLRAIGGPHQEQIEPVLWRAIARFGMIRSFHDTATGTSASAYARKVATHGWPGLIEALRYLLFALRRKPGA